MGRTPNAPDETTYRGRFAANLRRFRISRFATQSDFVDALSQLGVVTTVQTVSGWETGYRVPDLEYWSLIAEALEIPVQQLLPKS